MSVLISVPIGMAISQYSNLNHACAFTLHFCFVVQLRVWSRPDAVDAGQVDYALDIGVRILTYFEDYFNVPYPLPKLGIYYIQNQLACRQVFTLRGP